MMAMRDKLLDIITVGIARYHVKKVNNENPDMAAIIADVLIENGYRKASDVAEETIGEVISKAKAIFCPDCDYDVADIRYALDWLEAEFKKKYTESEKEKC
jgi:hypothetical protein